MPQRLLVPAFQRRYVWAEESQWEPLWQDVVRVATRLLDDPLGKTTPHFLGAIVLQQTANPTGSLPERTVIDGQQRLTTLQLLLDALELELRLIGETKAANRIAQLVENQADYTDHPNDRFKVWPTNRDQPAFYKVMGAEEPHGPELAIESPERLVQAHRYFSRQARSWLRDGPVRSST